MDKYKEFLNTLRARVPIVDVVSQKTKLTKRGHDYFGLCPFHSEKTGSFKVDPVKGLYYCFGCGKHGDIFTFIMDSEHVTFMEAAEKLAVSIGLEVPKFTKQADNKYQSTYKLMEEIQIFFEESLEHCSDPSVSNYLRYRGISKEDIGKFHIGFAGNNQNLFNYLKKKSFKEDDLIKSGVFFRCGIYLKNKFDKRLIFPIFDIRGKCIGFGGRTLVNEEPKYINSPETEIFKKNENLYGYHLARKGTYKDLILVEGYLDVISMHRAGFDKTVAGLGTAIGENQIDLCWKISDEPIVLLDGDAAGIKAAYRFMLRVLPKLSPGKSFRFATIPNGDDPDSVVLTGGAQKMQTILDGAVPLQEWLWRAGFSLFPSDTPEQKSAILQTIKEHIDTIENKSIKYLYKQWLYEKSKNMLFGKTKKNSGSQRKINFVYSNTEKYQQILLALVMKCPYILDRNIERFAEITFINKRYEDIKEMILKQYSEKNNIDDVKEKLYNVEYDFLQRVSSYTRINFEETDRQTILHEWESAYNNYFAIQKAKEQIKLTKDDFRSSFSIEDWNKFKALKEAMFKANDIK